MRLWSLHPQYLDTKGLVAVWREGLLALHVLKGLTKGYTQHPQLIRFKNHPRPVDAITNYLHAIVDVAEKRNYKFDRTKLGAVSAVDQIPVTIGQMAYETQHLKQKLAIRDPERFKICEGITHFECHPSFEIVPGEIEDWEKIDPND